MANCLQTRKPQAPLLKLMRSYTQLINRIDSKMETHVTRKETHVTRQRKLEKKLNSISTRKFQEFLV